jgi:hypothetical protein
MMTSSYEQAEAVKSLPPSLCYLDNTPKMVMNETADQPATERTDAASSNLANDSLINPIKAIY